MSGGDAGSMWEETATRVSEGGESSLACWTVTGVVLEEDAGCGWLVMVWRMGS